MLCSRSDHVSLLRPSTLSDTNLANKNIFLIGFVKTQGKNKKICEFQMFSTTTIVLFSVRENELKYQTTFQDRSVDINCEVQNSNTNGTFF